AVHQCVVLIKYNRYNTADATAMLHYETTASVSPPDAAPRSPPSIRSTNRATCTRPPLQMPCLGTSLTSSTEYMSASSGLSSATNVSASSATGRPSDSGSNSA